MWARKSSGAPGADGRPTPGPRSHIINSAGVLQSAFCVWNGDVKKYTSASVRLPSSASVGRVDREGAFVLRGSFRDDSANSKWTPPLIALNDINAWKCAVFVCLQCSIMEVILTTINCNYNPRRFMWMSWVGKQGKPILINGTFIAIWHI